MDRRHTWVESSRRSFFKKILFLGGGAVLAVTGNKAAYGSVPLGKESQASKSGYRLTAHIKKYYEAAGR